MILPSIPDSVGCHLYVDDQLSVVHDTSVLNEGLVPLIKDLKVIFNIGLIANADMDITKEFLSVYDKINLRSLFDVIVTSQEVQSQKT